MAEMRDYHSGGSITAAPAMPLSERFDIVYAPFSEPLTIKPSLPVLRGGIAPAGKNYMVWEEVDGYVIMRVAQGAFHVYEPGGVALGSHKTLMEAQLQCSKHRYTAKAAEKITVSLQDVIDEFNTNSPTPRSKPTPKPEPKPTPDDYGDW